VSLFKLAKRARKLADGTLSKHNQKAAQNSKSMSKNDGRECSTIPQKNVSK